MLFLRGACAVLLLLASACSPGARRTAADVASGVATLAPVVCNVVAATGVQATACGPIASDVADVTALVAKILETWPRTARAAAPAAPVVLVIRGVAVTLAPDAAAYVQQQLVART